LDFFFFCGSSSSYYYYYYEIQPLLKTQEEAVRMNDTMSILNDILQISLK